MVSLCQGDLVSSFGCCAGRLHPSGSSSNDQDLLHFGGRGDSCVRFKSCSWIDQAGYRFILKQAIKTPLVTGHTVVDPFGLSFFGFGGKVRICKESPCHGHHVGLNILKDLFSETGIVDPVTDEDWDGYGRFDPLGQVDKALTGHEHGQLGNACFMPPPGYIEKINARLLQRGSKDSCLFVGVSFPHKLAACQSNADGIIRPHGLSHFFHHFQGESHPVLCRTAIGVIPLICHGGEELADQVPCASQDFYPIESRPLSAQSGLCEFLLKYRDFIQF